MRDIWYADKRDLVKWAVLCHLADDFKVKKILQVAFYRSNDPDVIVIDEQRRKVPQEVSSHFRNIQNICLMKSKVSIEVFDKIFEDRENYLRAVTEKLSEYRKQNLIVFLDPDTGFQPKTKRTLEHVSEQEARAIFEALKPNDVFVFYQHQTNRRGEDWINPKKNQLAKAIGLSESALKLAYGPKIANDVALFYVQKH